MGQHLIQQQSINTSVGPDVTGPHPCSELDGESMTLKEAGLCSHHWVKSSGELGRIEYNATYTMLLNNVTGLEIVPG